jgi:hypothetical protein
MIFGKILMAGIFIAAGINILARQAASKKDSAYCRPAILRLSLLVKKEIYNRLWFNICGGLSHKINFNLTNSPGGFIKTIQ